MRINEIIAYHGSQSRPTIGFDISHTGHNAHTFGDYDSTRYGTFFTTNPRFAELYGDVNAYELMISKTIDLDSKQSDSTINEFIDRMFEKDRNVAFDAKNVHYTWNLFEDNVGKYFVSFLKSKGFDSARFTEFNTDENDKEIKSETIVVFDPSKIIKNKQIPLDL